MGVRTNEEEGVLDDITFVALLKDTITLCVTGVATLKAGDCSIEFTVPIFEGVCVDEADEDSPAEPPCRFKEVIETETHTRLVQP